jgi:hypothetical protein
VPLSVLRDAPFNLEFGDSVFMKVAALNVYGSSGFSQIGNGATI